jgi:hypothetical protein
MRENFIPTAIRLARGKIRAISVFLLAALTVAMLAGQLGLCLTLAVFSLVAFFPLLMAASWIFELPENEVGMKRLQEKPFLAWTAAYKRAVEEEREKRALDLLAATALLAAGISTMAYCAWAQTSGWLLFAAGIALALLGAVKLRDSRRDPRVTALDAPRLRNAGSAVLRAKPSAAAMRVREAGRARKIAAACIFAFGLAAALAADEAVKYALISLLTAFFTLAAMVLLWGALLLPDYRGFMLALYDHYPSLARTSLFRRALEAKKRARTEGLALGSAIAILGAAVSLLWFAQSPVQFIAFPLGSLLMAIGIAKLLNSLLDPYELAIWCSPITGFTGYGDPEKQALLFDSEFNAAMKAKPRKACGELAVTEHFIVIGPDAECPTIIMMADVLSARAVEKGLIPHWHVEIETRAKRYSLRAAGRAEAAEAVEKITRNRRPKPACKPTWPSRAWKDYPRMSDG